MLLSSLGIYIGSSGESDLSSRWLLRKKVNVFGWIYSLAGKACKSNFVNTDSSIKLSLGNASFASIRSNSANSRKPLQERKTNPLFPSITSLQNISNSKNQTSAPIICAADDLELSLAGSHDQIEFFNTIDRQDHFSVSSSLSSSTVVNNGLPEFDDFYEAHSHHQNNQGYDTFNDTVYDNAPTGHSTNTNQYIPHPVQAVNNTYYDMKSSITFAPNSQLPQMSQYDEFSHYNLNMIGIHNSNSYFNDFNHPRKAGAHPQQSFDDLLSNSSLSSSDISPLDDEFFKKLTNSYESGIKRHESVSRTNDLGNFKSPENFRTNLESPGLRNLESPEDLRNLPIYETGLKMSPPYIKKRKIDEDNESKAAKKFKKNELPVEDRKSSHNQEPVYECSFCDASFRVKGYLTRHMKKHSSSKAFLCPFYQKSTEGHGHIGTKCHPTGGFSRRDTYKTHLKALHFIYPPGTKLSERNSNSGRCAGCFQYFENNYKWLEKHIETGVCQGTVQFKEQILHGAEPSKSPTKQICRKQSGQDIKVKREFREDMCDSMHYGKHDLVD